MDWLDYVQPGMTVVDIGANIGGYTAGLKERAGPTGLVIAIEPNPAAIAQLCSVNADRILQIAVSDVEGQAQFYFGTLTEHGSLVKANVLNPTGEAMNIPVATIDGLQRRRDLPTPIDFVKVDAQGAEAAILRGAARCLARQEAIWYLELWSEGLDQAGDSVEDVAHVAENAGYVLENGDSWSEVCAKARTQHGHGSIDVLMVPKSRNAYH